MSQKPIYKLSSKYGRIQETLFKSRAKGAFIGMMRKTGPAGWIPVGLPKLKNGANFDTCLIVIRELLFTELLFSKIVGEYPDSCKYC